MILPSQSRMSILKKVHVYASCLCYQWEHIHYVCVWYYFIEIEPPCGCLDSHSAARLDLDITFMLSKRICCKVLFVVSHLQIHEEHLAAWRSRIAVSTSCLRSVSVWADVISDCFDCRTEEINGKQHLLQAPSSCDFLCGVCGPSRRNLHISCPVSDQIWQITAQTQVFFSFLQRHLLWCVLNVTKNLREETHMTMQIHNFWKLT